MLNRIKKVFGMNIIKNDNGSALSVAFIVIAILTFSLTTITSMNINLSGATTVKIDQVNDDSIAKGLLRQSMDEFEAYIRATDSYDDFNTFEIPRILTDYGVTVEDVTGTGDFLDYAGTDSYVYKFSILMDDGDTLYKYMFSSIYGSSVETFNVFDYSIGTNGQLILNSGLYDEVYLQYKAGNKDIEVIHFDSIQNPFYDRSLWDRHKKTLPPALFDQRHRGRFTRSEGQIYDVFDNDVHAIKQFAIPAGTPIKCGIDPGIVNHATLMLAEFYPGTALFEKKFPHAVGDAPVYVIYEVDITGSTGTTMTNVEHARMLKEREDYSDITTIFGGAKAEIYFREDYAIEGVNVLKPPTGEVESGIEAVYQLFKENRLYKRYSVDCDCCKSWKAKINR